MGFTPKRSLTCFLVPLLVFISVKCPDAFEPDSELVLIGRQVCFFFISFFPPNNSSRHDTTSNNIDFLFYLCHVVVFFLTYSTCNVLII